jgi:hypothetical protein
VLTFVRGENCIDTFNLLSQLSLRTNTRLKLGFDFLHEQFVLGLNNRGRRRRLSGWSVNRGVFSSTAESNNPPSKC